MSTSEKIESLKSLKEELVTKFADIAAKAIGDERDSISQLSHSELVQLCSGAYCIISQFRNGASNEEIEMQVILLGTNNEYGQYISDFQKAWNFFERMNKSISNKFKTDFSSQLEVGLQSFLQALKEGKPDEGTGTQVENNGKVEDGAV